MLSASIALLFKFWCACVDAELFATENPSPASCKLRKSSGLLGLKRAPVCHAQPAHYPDIITTRNETIHKLVAAGLELAAIPGEGWAGSEFQDVAASTLAHRSPASNL
eukprot:3360967-Rhodomonas_salina.1